MDPPVIAAYLGFAGALINGYLIYLRGVEREDFDRRVTELKHELDLVLKREEAALRSKSYVKERAVECAAAGASKLFDTIGQIIVATKEFCATSNDVANCLGVEEADKCLGKLDSITRRLDEIVTIHTQLADYYTGAFYKDIMWLEVDGSFIDVSTQLIRDSNSLLKKCNLSLSELNKLMKLKVEDSPVEDQVQKVLKINEEAMFMAIGFINIGGRWKNLLFSKTG